MDPTDEIPVLYQDLLLIRNALDNAASASTAVDILASYRDLKTQSTRSKLTKQLNYALNRTDAIIASGSDDVIDDE